MGKEVTVDARGIWDDDHLSAVPWDRYRWIGAPEAAASVGLLIGYASAPFAAAAAVGLVALMAGALTFRLRIHDSAAFLLGDVALLGLAAATAVLRITAG